MRRDQRMFEAKNFHSVIQLAVVLLLLMASSLAQAPADKDKEKETEKTGAKNEATRNLINVTGAVRCDKPDPAYSMEVPDRPGHALKLAKRKCTWTEPMVVNGVKSKDGIAIEFPEQMEGTLHTHGFEVDTYDTGEKVTWKSMGTIDGVKGPAAAKGRWSLMSGTGKLQGIKGGGSYEGKLDANDVLTLEFEGVYDPSDMQAEKK
jgi:hypothetical protein